MALEEQRYGRNKGTLVNKAYIESGDYRKKFDKITDNPVVARRLYEVSKKMLLHRSGTKIEDMYWLDFETGEEIVSITNQTSETEQEIVYTDRVINSIADKENLITLHNHPASMPPSPDDFNAYYQNGYRVGLVICHDGTIYQYEAEQSVSTMLYGLYVYEYMEQGMSEKEAQLSALEEMKKNSKIDFWEVIA